jgi:hypothetical protein
MSQSTIEGLLRAKAKNQRKPKLLYSLAKLERKIANPPGPDAAESKRIYYEETKPTWENLCQQYRDELAEIEAGNYHGYNGKPFGAHPTVKL